MRQSAAPGSLQTNIGAVSLADIEHPPRDLKKTTFRLFLYGIVLAILAWSWQGAEIRPMALINDAGNMLVFGADFFPPDFHEWRYYLSEIIITLHIAIWGTIFAVIAAVPLGLLAASNISPWWIHQPVRRLLDSFRAINEMVFAMLFVVSVGLGPFAGVMALFIHTTGTLAKLFSEAVEAIDPQPVEGIRATGATQIEEICYGVIPQVMPLWISYTLYRFEANVRSASVVGMVGAGGVGVVLWEVIRGFQFAKTAAVLLMLIVTVSLVDVISSRIRKRFI